MAGAKLSHRVQFRRATPRDDGLAQVEHWGDHGAPIWADREDLGGQEVWAAGQVGARATTRFLVEAVPFTRDLSPRDRLVCDGQSFDIILIRAVILRRRLLEITAVARTDT